jgi:hypothetical protein
MVSQKWKFGANHMVSPKITRNQTYQILKYVVEKLTLEFADEIDHDNLNNTLNLYLGMKNSKEREEQEEIESKLNSI